jgi:hypothetical protein
MQQRFTAADGDTAAGGLKIQIIDGCLFMQLCRCTVFSVTIILPGMGI